MVDGSAEGSRRPVVRCVRCGWIYAHVSPTAPDADVYPRHCGCGSTSFAPADPSDVPLGATVTGIVPAGHVPNVHVLRTAFGRGVGAARARGATGCQPLLDAAVAEIVAWGAERPGYALDVDGARAALLAMGGGPDSAWWDEPPPETEPLPDGLDALVAYAVKTYGLTCMWFANVGHIAAHPRTSWRAVTEMLRNYGGPDPHPFYLADAIERAAATEGANDADS